MRAGDLRSLARDVFDQILGGELAVQAVDHPLDFVCIPVVRKPGFGVCGHIWRGAHAEPTIHSHSWRLHSEIVLGAIANEVFRVTEQPDGDHQVVRIHSTGRTDRMVPTGTSVRVAGETTGVHRAGDSYALEANVFHRSTPVAAGPTLTLVRATMLAGHHDQIVVRATAPTRTTHRKLLSENAALTLVALFRDAITPTDAPAGTRPHRSHAPGRPAHAD